jgi:hypothetical protein
LLPGPNRSDQGPGLWCRLELVLLSKPPGELLIDLNGTGPVTDTPQQLDEPPRLSLVVLGEGESLSSPVTGGYGLPTGLLSLGEGRGRVSRATSEPDSLLFQPSLEVSAARDVKPLQQVAPVQCEGAGRVIRLDRRLEVRHVARKSLRIDSHFSVTPARHHLLT